MTLAVPATIWAHKAHALLIPTPLANLDPEGEPVRVAELRALLDQHGLDIPDWTDELHAFHRRAHLDARRAHLGAATEEAPTPLPPQRLGLRHPLSNEPLPGRPELTPARWPELLDPIRRCLAAADPQARYLALWRTLMGPDAPLGLAHIPGDPIINDHSLVAHRSASAALVGARLGDSNHQAALLHLHIGPVQSFISAARRTQDLWIGSYIVAYLSMQAVAAIAEQLGPDAVLYPDLSTLQLYGAVAGFGERRTDQLAWLRASLPNRCMALVPVERARELAQAAAERVVETWSTIADQVLTYLNDATISADPNFKRQIDAHLEIDATIQPWGEHDAYSETFARVSDDLTAQRRILTDLPPHGSAVAKCTQCGEREQLGPDEAFWRGLRVRLKDQDKDQAQAPGTERETIDLRDGEALCAVCLTKRFANRGYFGAAHTVPTDCVLQLDWTRSEDRLRLRFPSVATIAAAPIRSALDRSAVDTSAWHGLLRDCHRLLKFTAPGNLLPGLGGPSRTGPMHLDADGTWFYDSSYEVDTALRDHDLARSNEDLGTLRTDLCARLPAAREALRRCLGQLAHSHGRSSAHITPYYAVISLDVDRMGDWLRGRHPKSSGPITPALHREVSRRQSRLASGPLFEIVEQDHLGRVVYSGGDDLLAFVPLATLWSCLHALHQRFLASDALGAAVTVSAGVAIAHWRAPLSQALKLVRHAEERAKERTKEPPDRLVISIDKRSGAPLIHQGSWDLVNLLQQAIPRVLDPTDDQAQAPSSRRLRLNTLDRLEHELAMLEACPHQAITARVFAHMTGEPVTKLVLGQDPVLDYIHASCQPQRTPQLLEFLHMLRFLAREHDPVIARLLPPSRPR